MQDTNAKRAQAATSSVRCESCGATVTVESLDEEMVTCPFCGTSFSAWDLIDDSAEVTAERIRSSAYREVESKRLEAENARRLREEKKAADREARAEVAAFRSGAASKLYIAGFVIAVLMAMTAFFSGWHVAGGIAIAQAALFLAAWLMGMQIIPSPRRHLSSAFAILALTCALPFLAAVGIQESESPSYDPVQVEWDALQLSDQLPKPELDTGYVWNNSTDSMSLYLAGASREQFIAYRDACRAAGYTEELDFSDSYLYAFNAEGYKLDLYYFASSSEIDINLDAPLPMAQMTWPSGTLADLLPVPASDVGYIESASSDYLVVYVGDTSKTAAMQYAQSCVNGGFSKDVNMYSDICYAKDEQGRDLRVSYEGNNVMRIALSAD